VDDKKKIEDETQGQPRVGSGSLLAAARKKQKKTVEEIADKLNLSVTQIATIELDQSEGLPEPTYVRGYIRSYARLLDLNVDEVLDHYLNPNWQKGARLDDMPRGIGNANDNEKRGFFTPFKVIFIIALLSILGFLWFTGKVDAFIGGEQLQSPERHTNASPVLNEVQAPVAPVAEVSSPESELTVNPQIDENNVNEQAPNEAETQAEPTENQLSLSFSNTSWVEIRDEEGNRLAFKSYAQGEDLTVSSRLAMTVFLGNAKAVSASINGEAYDISKHREGAFARFQVGE